MGSVSNRHLPRKTARSQSSTAMASKQTESSSTYSQGVYEEDLTPLPATDKDAGQGKATFMDMHLTHNQCGLLLGFETSGAYTNPRPAPPTPPFAKSKTVALTAARSPPSSPPLGPLPRLSLIAIPHESTEQWVKGPPSSLTTTESSISNETDPDGWLRGYLAEKKSQAAVAGRKRRDWQGVWLRSGTMRGKKETGSWLSRGTLRGEELARSGHIRRLYQGSAGSDRATDSGRSSQGGWSSGSGHSLLARVRDGARRCSARLSISMAFPELAKTAERIGHVPAF